MNTNDRQDKKKSDDGEIVPKLSCRKNQDVTPLVANSEQCTELEGYSNFAQFTEGAVPTHHHHSRSVIQKQQEYCQKDSNHSGVDTFKIDPTALSTSSRQHKKKYVKKLKDLVESIHFERSGEIRQRLLYVQQSADLCNARRKLISSFLKYHSSYETDRSKWSTIIEETFLLKQPVTPFRSFQESEIEKEYRFSRGMDAVIDDAASLAVMLENIGCHSLRWVRIKRESFLIFEEMKRCPTKKMPSCVERQSSRLFHSVSSLSGSSPSDSSNDEEPEQKVIVTGKGKTEKKCTSKHRALKDPNSTEMVPFKQCTTSDFKTNKVSSSSGGSGSDVGSNNSSGFQDFHIKQLSIQKEGSNDSPSDNSVEISQNRESHFSGMSSNRVASSSSGDDVTPPPAAKRLKADTDTYEGTDSKVMPISVSTSSKKHVNNRAFPGNMKRPANASSVSSHVSVAPTDSNSKTSTISKTLEDGPHLIVADTMPAFLDAKDTNGLRITGRYIINDDDILSMEDILMCPFVFRSENAVVCGALAECVMPGMLRAQFSSRNKLQSLELVYDAMGFTQQLERASGRPLPLTSIPRSLGVALSPNFYDAQVITLAAPPYTIINVNEMWTRISGYTQLECEGKGYLELLEGDATVPEAKSLPGKPAHFLDQVAKGQPACSTNIHYDRNGRDFIEFVCSYPLTNSRDEVTHILHVSRELPSFETLSLQAKNFT